MGKPGYPEEIRQKAIQLYLEEGYEVAEEETGVKAGTIASWVSRGGYAKVAQENRLKAIEARKAENELRWERIQDKICQKLEELLDDLDTPMEKVFFSQKGDLVKTKAMPDASDKRQLLTAFGILFDKRQLATGGSTSNTNATVSAPDLKALVTKKAENEAVKQTLREAVEGEG